MLAIYIVRYTGVESSNLLCFGVMVRALCEPMVAGLITLYWSPILYNQSLRGSILVIIVRGLWQDGILNLGGGSFFIANHFIDNIAVEILFVLHNLHTSKRG